MSIIFVLSGCFVVNATTEPTSNNNEVNMVNELPESRIVITTNQVFGSESLKVNVEITQTGTYTLGLNYLSKDDSTSEITMGVKVDGDYPTDDAEKIVFPRMWMDHNREECVDDYGNEYAAQQVPYDKEYYNVARTDASDKDDELFLELTVGVHEIELIPKNGEIDLKEIILEEKQEPAAYQQPKDDEKKYEGLPIVIEAEESKVKSSHFLVGKTDSSSTLVTPNSPHKNLVNYIGAGNWKETGDTIVWETPELEAGYYQLGFSFRQNTIIGGKTYRLFKIDGEVPFDEAKEIGFGYDDNWKQEVYADENGVPYLIWLSEGKHELSLTVTTGPIREIRDELRQTVAALGEMYIEITMITGEEVDIYRDYELFSQIPEMEERLKTMRESLVRVADGITEVTGEKSGSQRSVVMNMVQAIDMMLENKYEAHRYKSYYYSNYCSTSSVLQDLSSMPLSLDKIVLAKAGEEDMFSEPSLLDKMLYSITRFFDSFVRDYNGVSNSEDKTEKITIWVNWGRDQAQVLKALVDRSFTPETGIEVDIQLTNATLIQATLSGNSPDCTLMHGRSEAVNLGMRGVLYDLTQFEDLDEVLERFQEGAEIPYRYKDGLYGLPDTQTFYMMFYRKDIFEQLNLKVPETWDEFEEVTKLLMRNKMTVWLQTATNTSDALAASGVGSINVFPSMLMQNGYSLYAEDGHSTTLLEPGSIEVFKYWTDYYTKLKLPKTLDFYNRFRTGTTPLGIVPYTTYTTLKVAATEIDGQWGIARIPGTVLEDGSISHASSGGGTHCAILKDSKNPEAAWEFLKWWTSAETQKAYSNDVEAILGPTGRIALANKEALKDLGWDEGFWEEIELAWDEVQEVPEFPGSYYVSRAIYQSYWNVVNDRENVKDVIMKYGKEANDEIARKWEQYQKR